MQRPNTLYNIGLYYKYRGAWAESFRYNKRAVEIRPTTEAANWNLAIAATALRDWATARACWQRASVKLPDGIGPIDADFGRTVVRLNPEGEAETVWARRICPVRARIENIPFPESGYAWGDVVLHDGAPMGSRLDAHDHDGGPVPWKPERQIGIAAGSEEEVEQLLDQWIGPGREVKSWGVALER